LTLGEREVPAREVGELVMNELKKLDKIAYIRFASVYKSFQDPDDFREMLQDLERAQQQGVDDLFE
jgi:transcriptional repressor NrdR